MKIFFLFALLTIGVSVYSFDAMTFPEQLKCLEILHVHGKAPAQKLQRLVIDNINSGQLMSEQTISSSGWINSQRSSDQIKLHFSNGDKIEKLVFLKEDLVKLSRKSVTSIRGLHQIGRWSPEGDQTDSLTVVKCF
jgi:hypothetical protein